MVSMIIYMIKLLGKSLYGFTDSSATVIGYSKLVYPKKQRAVPLMTPETPPAKKGLKLAES